jgi:hypothetical protein
MSSTVGAWARSQASATWAGVQCRLRAAASRGGDSRTGFSGKKAGVVPAGVEQRLFGPAGQVVGVLDTGHVDPGPSGEIVVEGDIAEPDTPDEALVEQGLHGRELLVEGNVGSREATEVDHRHAIELQAAEVGDDAGAQFLGALGRQPPGLLVAGGPDLGHEDQSLRIGMQGFMDELVGHVGAVVLGGVDVVDTPVDGPAQHGDGTVAVGRWTEHSGAGELHGAEPHPVDRAAGEGNGQTGHDPY